MNLHVIEGTAFLAPAAELGYRQADGKRVDEEQ